MARRNAALLGQLDDPEALTAMLSAECIVKLTSPGPSGSLVRLRRQTGIGFRIGLSRQTLFGGIPWRELETRSEGIWSTY